MSRKRFRNNAFTPEEIETLANVSGVKVQHSSNKYVFHKNYQIFHDYITNSDIFLEKDRWNLFEVVMFIISDEPYYEDYEYYKRWKTEWKSVLFYIQDMKNLCKKFSEPCSIYVKLENTLLNCYEIVKIRQGNEYNQEDPSQKYVNKPIIIYGDGVEEELIRILQKEIKNKENNID